MVRLGRFCRFGRHSSLQADVGKKTPSRRATGSLTSFAKFGYFAQGAVPRGRGILTGEDLERRRLAGLLRPNGATLPKTWLAIGLFGRIGRFGRPPS
jgi:hypothetical protein